MDQTAQTAIAADLKTVDHVDSPSSIDPQEERRLVWKVDLLLMPILTISYGIQFYDKAVLGSASVFGIIPDLGLSTVNNGVTSTLRYSSATAFFYYGYMVAVLPFALLLQRVPIAKTLGVLIVLWGLVCILTVVVSSYQGLFVQRFFLGLIESTVSPGFVILTNRWYKQSELALRIGIWYSATGLFSMFSGILNYAIGHASGPLPVWKYMYILAGSWTMAFGLVVLALLPDSIAGAKRLFNDRERDLLQRRVAGDQRGAADRRFRADQAVEAGLDPKLWLFLFMGGACYLVNGAVTAFGARIISTFGYSPLNSLLLQIPGGAATCVSIYLTGWIVGRWRNITTYVLAVSALFPLIGAIVIWKSNWQARPGVAVFGYTLLPTFGAPYVLILALSAANVAGGTKKALSAAFIFIGYNAGNIAAPYTVLTPQAADHYPATFITVIVAMCFLVVSSLVLRLYLIAENRKKDRQQGEAVAALAASARSSFDDDKAEMDDEHLHVVARDLTDRQNPFMRYSL